MSDCDINDLLRHPAKVVKVTKFKNNIAQNATVYVVNNIPILLDVYKVNVYKEQSVFKNTPFEKKRPCKKYTFDSTFSEIDTSDGEISTSSGNEGYVLLDNNGQFRISRSEINFGDETSKQYTLYVDNPAPAGAPTGGRRTRKRRSKKSRKSRRPRKSRKSRR